MAFVNLLIENLGAVRRITVNRPDKLNALNAATLDELTRAFEDAGTDGSVRAVILRGAGEKAFVAGADISELATVTPVQARDFARRGQRTMRTVETLGKPVIAQISGYALGGGMELALACHLRIASEKARLGQPEVNLGVLPGFGGTQRLLRVTGRGATLELCLTGVQIDAARAYQLNLVNRVVAPEALESETLALAEQLAASAPEALRGVLDAVILGGEADLVTGLDYEAQAFATSASTEDMREGTRAFLERRKPAFTGR
ncbi:enoyl-CoA hydratase-related protein [Denitratimonas tolerans]|uniref:Enoyl-CoA hydratase-related protein n=1 Tax=Denitratimonas tolerans TaxID=1338420 RepID=A0AAW9R864_9GAMM|nr:enoyl-CoA hydratase-related protein [Xanthomonadaceae bacterium]MEB2314635.1 enoyl-CoA hydratase-related protein [Xanthomonadaceae bacterium]HMN34208.1 enoyl-CoA hydratase-related protein [Chiayiivirga sp.]HRO88679.1 enoyl-CoA hydratase-related protein [Chiayiivirga sp.]